MKKLPTLGWRTLRSFLFQNALQLCLVALFLPFALPTVQAQCNNTTVLSITGPLSSTWTAPATGGPFTINITATGAGGGAYLQLNPDQFGGSGSTVSNTFSIPNGTTIRAIAGGPGEDSELSAGGGGGGSGAVDCGNPSDCINGTILIIAAAGNGGAPDNLGLGGSSTSGTGNGGAAGANDGGGGGGGELDNGGNAMSGGGGGAIVSLIALSIGGTGNTGGNGGNGMGGGGGGGDSDEGSGGGGGHTGAGGDNASTAQSFGGTGTSGSNGNSGGSNGPSFGTVTIVCISGLPVELINFQAVIQKSGAVELLWSTATEKNNRGYDVERSADNRNWSSLGFVPGYGTTASRHDYRFTDENPLAGINYYRLKQMDTDGKYEYSPMVVADVRANGSQFDVFPNPSTNGELSIRAVSKQEGDALLEIFSWAGHKVYHETIRVYEGTLVSPLNMATFPKGAYTARLEMPDGTVQFKKILLQ